MNSKLQWAGDDQWSLTNDGVEFARFDEGNRRALFHWTGLVFADLAETKAYLDHTDDLTQEMVFNTFIADLTEQGVNFCEPSDPLHDPEFIALLNNTYAMAPQEYPADAPL